MMMRTALVEGVLLSQESWVALSFVLSIIMALAEYY